MSKARTISQITAPIGSSLVGFIQSSTGAIATTAAAKFGESIDAINDLGCDNTGATNTTTALLAFYTACISSGKKGRIRAGTYKVTPGVLIFNCNQLNKAFPVIETDGYDSVFFVVDVATSVNAPILQWTNGTSTGSTYQWLGGYHGGVTFSDSTGATATGRAAISLTGVNGLTIGRMVGNNLTGDLVVVPQALYGGTTPDQYAVSNLHYDILEANNCHGYAINNLNYVGQDSWIGNGVRAIGSGGGIFGSGSGCRFGELTVANCAGYGYDDGTYIAATGGSPQRNYITIAEMDNVQYPFRFNKTSNTIFLGLRIIHRFNVAPNVSGLYWPRIGIDLAGGASANCTNLQIQVFHRIEAGGVLGNLGIFCTGNNSGNISNISIDVDYADNGALGVTDSLLFTGFVSSVAAYMTRKSHPLLDTLDKVIGCANGSSAISIVSNTGYTAAPAKIGFATQPFTTLSNPIALNNASFNGSTATNVLTLTSDATGSFTVGAILYGTSIPVGTVISSLASGVLGKNGSTYNLSTSPGTLGSAALTCVNTVFTAPRAGLYEFNMKYGLTVAIGTRSRCGFYDGTNTHGTNYGYQVNAGYQTYSTTAQIYLNAGQQIWPCADQNTAGAVAISINHNVDECQFSVKAL